MSRYRFENIVPQWRTLNFGLWRKVELEIQNMVQIKPVDERVMIVTGSYEKCSLTNYHRKPEEIFLTLDKQIPVPKYIWKLYYNFSQPNNSIVYIGINNPYETITDSTYICPNTCPNYFNYHYGSSSNSSGGLDTVFCCTPESFFNVYGILNNIALTVFQ